MNKLTVVALLLSFVGVFSAFVPQAQDPALQNLKVLPKDMTFQEVREVMKGFNAALGVKCDFCHVPSSADPKKLDFASDENHHKDIARKMIRMTAKINRKYFNDHAKEGNTLTISCATCHNGQKHPKSI
ncbi:c-type cytochrome [Parapedobacter sp. GCM10030251]|mgnify:CR=1 FL=1|jgi:Photosynthetic reaction centre cytochrome C subunit.|uniref:c-type cytochrome n=1 Tax=Parapedobacter sp. GCM10030251 TaxID=3273419 RepID=UPI003612811E